MIIDDANQPVVFIEDNVDKPVDSFHKNAWVAAHDGGTINWTLPYIEVGSGRRISNGYVDFNQVYTSMINADAALPPQADVSAVYNRVGNSLHYSINVTNHSGMDLSTNNGAQVSVIVFEKGYSQSLTGQQVRAYTSSPFSTPLADGASRGFDITVDSIPSDAAWDHLQSVVLVDAKPAGKSHWENLQAAIAQTSAPVINFTVAPNQVQWVVDPVNPNPQARTITLSLPGMSSWSSSTSRPWLVVTPASGTAGQSPVISIDVSKLPAGMQNGSITFTAKDSSGTSYSAQVGVSAYLGKVWRIFSPLLMANK
ncbi:MAG: hypothetical protein ACM3PY_13275 [Omnitrophica WOR_2 bacterium]